jgi:hypothetical protein
MVAGSMAMVGLAPTPTQLMFCQHAICTRDGEPNFGWIDCFLRVCFLRCLRQREDG